MGSRQWLTLCPSSAILRSHDGRVVAMSSMDGFCSLTILPEQVLGRIVPLSAEQETEEAEAGEAAASPAAGDAAGTAEQPPAVSVSAAAVVKQKVCPSTLHTIQRCLLL